MLCSRDSNASPQSIRESQYLLQKHLPCFMLLHSLRVSGITAMSSLNYLETFPHPHHSPLKQQPRLRSHSFQQQCHSRFQYKLPSHITQYHLTSLAFPGQKCNQWLIRAISKSISKVKETKISSGKQSFSTIASSRAQALNGQHKQLRCRARWDRTGQRSG